MEKFRLIVFILLFIAEMFCSSSVYAEGGIILIPGAIDCSDHYSERCGWPSGRFYNPEGGGGGSSGSGGSSATTGTSMDFNRQPECKRETDFVASTTAAIEATGTFIGTQIPIIVTDPNFGDGQWLKFQTLTIQTEWSADNPRFKREFKIVMHYMYNVTTGQVFQTKLKNSSQYGCEGIVKTA